MDNHLNLELKPLPSSLKYMFLEENNSFSVIIAADLNSKWVSPTQVVPKKSGITVIKNENGDEIQTRLTTEIL
ncbi:unnamed protein product [Spirodela intermedia]|uniref:Uncharacterized protein n=1 Tax=Spirodela intermedia TaxID=51605 RepID=A0A7I8JK75_SPIIN|nr:unnamed protein product [Spirodela intermedia]CAA6670460.1 unnamed protein product [Spirodela intermedia]